VDCCCADQEWQAADPERQRWHRVLPCRKRCQTTLIKRSFSLVDHRTSVALEQEFWAALTHIAASRQQTVTALVAEADAQRPEGRPLASALRVFALQAFFRQPSTATAPNDR
jgi:predicted DNA-binding ribbon-helix-helix protein